MRQIIYNHFKKKHHNMNSLDFYSSQSNSVDYNVDSFLENEINMVLNKNTDACLNSTPKSTC